MFTSPLKNLRTIFSEKKQLQQLSEGFVADIDKISNYLNSLYVHPSEYQNLRDYPDEYDDLKNLDNSIMDNRAAIKELFYILQTSHDSNTQSFDFLYIIKSLSLRDIAIFSKIFNHEMTKIAHVDKNFSRSRNIEAFAYLGFSHIFSGNDSSESSVDKLRTMIKFFSQFAYIDFRTGDSANETSEFWQSAQFSNVQELQLLIDIHFPDNELISVDAYQDNISSLRRDAYCAALQLNDFHKEARDGGFV